MRPVGQVERDGLAVAVDGLGWSSETTSGRRFLRRMSAALVAMRKIQVENFASRLKRGSPR
jgi:hypothetical protein